jgi:hypothetical protein
MVRVLVVPVSAANLTRFDRHHGSSLRLDNLQQWLLVPRCSARVEAGESTSHGGRTFHWLADAPSYHDDLSTRSPSLASEASGNAVEAFQKQHNSIPRAGTQRRTVRSTPKGIY